MAKATAEEKIYVHPKPGVTVYHGIHVAGPGMMAHLPKSHATDLLASEHVETPQMKADREKLEADGASPTVQ
jgi:hypothetical protein